MWYKGIKEQYPALWGLVDIDNTMIALLSPEEVDKELRNIFQLNAKVAIDHIRDSLTRRSCGFSGTLKTTREWTTSAKRSEALRALAPLMREAGMVVDSFEDETWHPYMRAFDEFKDVAAKDEIDDETKFGVRNAIEEYMGLARTQEGPWDADEDVDDRLLCEYILQEHDATECKGNSDGWRYVHGCEEGGEMSYIPSVSIKWFKPPEDPSAQYSSSDKWLTAMWDTQSETSDLSAADFWTRRFFRLGVPYAVRQKNGWVSHRARVVELSYHTFLDLQEACNRILGDVYADRLALLLLAARHDSSCALSTHFPALRFEGCKPFIKIIASFLTKPLPVMDRAALLKAKFFDPPRKSRLGISKARSFDSRSGDDPEPSGDKDPEPLASKQDWDAGCQKHVVYAAKTFIQALTNKKSSTSAPDVTSLLRPLLGPHVRELYLNGLRFVNDKHLDETIFAAGQQLPNLVTLDLSRTSVTADHVITRVCGPFPVGGAPPTPVTDLPFPNLARLNLNYTSGSVSVVGMRQLGATALVSLVHLHLRGKRLHGYLLREMCSLAPDRFLTLDLAKTNVQNIACLPQTQKKLQHLNLADGCVNAVCERM